MALPKINVPLYEVKLPSSGKKIKYRPFLVKEEKILIYAQSSGEPMEYIRAIEQVVNNCIIEGDVHKFSSADLEFLFIKLRSASVSNIAKLKYYDDELNEYVDVEIDIDNLTIDTSNMKSNIIDVTDSIKLELRLPSYNDIAEVEGAENSLYKMITRIIECVYEGDEEVDPKDYSEEELLEFVDSIPTTPFRKITEFLDNVPTIKLEFEYEITVKKKTKKKKGEFTSISDFF